MQTYWGGHEEYTFCLQSCWEFGFKAKQKLKFYFNAVREGLTRMVGREDEAHTGM